MHARYEEHRLSENKRVILGSPEFYRARAKEMLELAAQTAREEAKASFMALAANWEGLADWAEHPDR